MSVVVGLAEYLGKGSADIFLFVAKVVHIYGEIHKAIYIIICSLVRVFCKPTFFSCSLLCHHWSSCYIKEEDKKCVSLSFRETPLQNQSQGRCPLYWSSSFLCPPIYIANLILFGSAFWCSLHFWTGRWEAFLLLPWTPVCLRQQSKICSLFLEIYIFLFSFSSIFSNFIIYDSIFEVISIHNDLGSRIMPLFFILE